MGRLSYENGKTGEEIAVQYITDQGYQVIERNFRSRQGEIDIIARDKQTLVFIEVKNYSFRSYGSPVGAVRKAKKESIIHAAGTYIYEKNIKNTFCRFDVVTIYHAFGKEPKIEHYKNAFFVN